MQPWALQSSFERYKRDTDSVAGWLASTAKACGYVFPAKSTSLPISSQDSEKASDHSFVLSKKQAKKIAKEKAAATAARKYIIEISDFIPLTRFITAHEPAVHVPPVFMKTLNRVIKLRSEHGDKLRENGVEVDPAADASHGYFTGVLEGVREDMIPLFLHSASAAFLQSSDVLPTANAFEGLTIEEPPQEFLEATDIEIERPVPVDDFQYEVKRPETVRELGMAYIMMHKDLNKLRERVIGIWNVFKAGKIDLVAAAIATNTAMDLARDLSKSVQDLFKESGHTLVEMSGRLYSGVCTQSGITSLEDIWSSKFPTRSFNPENYEIASGAFLVAHMMLRQVAPHTKDGHSGLCFVDEKSTGVNLAKDRAEMSGLAKWDEDKSLFLALVNETVLTTTCPNWPVEDELVRAVKEFLDTGKEPMHIVFAVQIYLDLHHLLREQIKDGYEALSSQTKMMSSDISYFLLYQKDLSERKDFTTVIDCLKGIQQRIDVLVQKDVAYPAKVKFWEQLGKDPGAPHFLMRHWPVTPGLVLYQFRVDMYQSGICVANIYGSLTSAAHLHHALMTENLAEKTWKDMSMTKSVLRENFFAGDPPSDWEGYQKQILFFLGVSPAMFSGHDIRKGFNWKSKGKPRGIKEECPVSFMFYNRVVQNRPSMNWTAKDVEKLIEQSTFSGFTGEMLFPMNEAELKEKREENKKQEKARRQHGSDTTLSSPEALVITLAKCLHVEMAQLSWPFMSMHIQSDQFLRRVHARCGPLLDEIHSSQWRTADVTESAPHIVAYMFHRDSYADSRLMKAAAEVMDTFAASKAGEFVLRKFTLTTGSRVEFGVDETTRDGKPVLMVEMGPEKRVNPKDLDA